MSAPYQAGGPPSGAPGGKTSLGLDSNVGAMLCYIANLVCCLGVILSIVFLVTEKENRFVKFHAVQSLFLIGAQIAIGIVVSILGLVLKLALGMADLDLLAFFVILGLRLILLVIFLAIWIVAGIKAYGGQWYKLPAIGDFAWNIVNK
ncbi:MAG TPA: DUF4870 domain-containing protein [Pyrinomonadaceae bacterium]|nr:DUF4870 domain-containing protein [Pyrinomonadaceae bacterium]